ncbi:hypothetical protein A9Q87_05390 [Flavobacteriales bacterium 34_180_T64]|nr:hypothetical protein A9Q87_05390 [Flavobacteriales bacterium 34_180_T64]
MKFSFSKLKSSKENSKINSEAVDKAFISDIVKDVDNEPFAISNQNVLYAGLNELGGYHVFQTVNVGKFFTKTVKGVQLSIIGKGFEIQLDSDMVELESERSSIPNRNISAIDFQIEPDDLDKIQAKRIEKMVLHSKKQTVEFEIFNSEKLSN